jgi:Peptidase family M23
MFARSLKILLATLFVLPAAQGAPPQPSGNQAFEDACENIARRAYDLCTHSPNSDRAACLRKYDEAYLSCAGERPQTPAGAGQPATKLSKNSYQIPYEDGTRVHITRGFLDHNGPGKIDMVGRGGSGEYRIVAAAAGHIRFIEDGRSKQQHPERWLRNTQECFNNYVWIEHANGEWSKYSHMQQGSTSGKAKLKVGDYVAAGRYLGDEGKVGCAWPAHLHFEVAVPSFKDGKPSIADPSGELAGYGFSQARDPVIAEIGGRPFKDGETYIAGGTSACSSDTDCGTGKYCNKGVDTTKNQCLPLKDDNEVCDLVGGGHQCKGGSCKLSRCYTPQSVSMGGTCYFDDACVAGKCSDVDGLKGECVCNNDSDCGSGNYCDQGLDTKINRCHSKLGKGAKCGNALSVGNDHKCQSGECSGFPKYECK